MHRDRTTGRWQTLTGLVGERLSFDLPDAGIDGYITLTREQAEERRNVLEFDGHLLPPLTDADLETVAELRTLLAQPNLGQGSAVAASSSTAGADSPG